MTPRFLRWLLVFSLLLPLFATIIPSADAQILKRIRNRVTREAERRLEDRAVEAARRTLDLAENAVVCAVTDEDCIEEARKQGHEPVVVDQDGKPVSGYKPASASANANGDTPGEGVWANYGFVSGDRVLFLHDFEGTRVGNFPSRLDYIAGDMDVVRIGSGDESNLALHSGSAAQGGGARGCFTIPLSEMLPERFTLEFRARYEDRQGRIKYYLFSDGSDDTPDTRCNYPPNPHLFVAPNSQGLQLPGGYGAAKSEGDAGFEPGVWSDVALGCDGPYCKMYVDGVRVANVPRYELPRASKLHFFFNGYGAMFVDDIRVAAGGPRSLYDDLKAEGVVRLTSIHFATGQATLLPTSTGALAQIEELLRAHPDIRVRIEGHTDNTGSDAVNAPLSQARAEAVRAWLIHRGIDASRMEAQGFGATQSVADNATPEGRALNRRTDVRLLE